MATFQERFKTLLDESEMNNVKFAEFLGFPRLRVTRYCNGATRPNYEDITIISAKCQVSADWLLGISDVRINENQTNPNVIDISDLSKEAQDKVKNIIEGIRLISK